MSDYDFMVIEWVDVEGKGQPILGTFTHRCMDDAAAKRMAEKISDEFAMTVGIVTILDGKAISISLPVMVADKIAQDFEVA